MALLPDVFVPEDAKSSSFEPLPAAWYEAEMTKSVLKSTKAKDGKYISMTFKINDEEFAGRFVFTNLNIVNKNDQAVAIAQSDLKAICEAVGHEGDLEDTEDLHNIPLMIKLVVKPETAQWPAKNEIKGYKEVE